LFVFRFYPVFFLLSSCLLFVTLLVYTFVVPKLLTDPGTRLQRHLALNMLFAFTIISANQLIGSDFDPASDAQHLAIQSPELCVANGYLIHYFFLTTYTFMTAICILNYTKFKTINLMAQMTDRTYYKYVVAGYLPPALLTATMALVHSASPCNIVSPKFGENACFFFHKIPRLVWFNIPIIVLLTINFYVFIYIVQKLCRFSNTFEETSLIDQ